MGQTTGETVHHLELDIGSIRVAMKRHGLTEPIPRHPLSIPEPIGSHRTYHDPDGALTDRYLLTLLIYARIPGTVTLENVDSRRLTAVSIRLD